MYHGFHNTLPPNYGSDVPVTESQTSAEDVQRYVETGLSLIAQYRLEAQDPRKQVALYKAKIQNLEQLKAKMPSLSGLYDRQINKLKAKLSAAEQQLQVRYESEAATRQWRGLGQAGIGVGIVVGVAALGLIGAATYRLAKG